MKPAILRILETELPEIFNREDDWNWPSSILVVDEDALADEEDPFDELFDPSIGESSLTYGLGDLPSPTSMEEIADRDPPPTDDLTNIIDKISGIWNDAIWPGSPGRALIDSDGQNNHIHADEAAFYLPWHNFNENTWGIYLVVEGIEALGLDLYRFGHECLTLGECNSIARTFLFYHEAYHNAVEAFSTRLETTHRIPIFVEAVNKLYAVPTECPPHEEALANAYALRKVRSTAFSYEKNKSIRNWKRQCAFIILANCVGQCEEPYCFGSDYIGRRSKSFAKAQHEFQEECLIETLGRNVPWLNSEIWRAAPRALAPSLRRNGAFSYVIGRNHPLASRVKAHVRPYDRRKFIKRLRKEVPGKIVHGGKHPSYQTITGQKVPIPLGDLKKGTADSILKQLGLKERYKTVPNFLQGETMSA